MELRIVKQPEWLKYKDVLRELEPGWPSLKGKVVGPNSYQALIYLEQFLMAHKAWSIVNNEFNAPELTYAERVRLNAEYWELVFYRSKIVDSINRL
jgi:predicted DNA-binding ArsR family transcriptional regulator